MSNSSDKVTATPERISELSGLLQGRIKAAVNEIERINLNTRLLAFNAQIEAARAGSAGVSFGVVSGEMVKLAENIGRVTTTISQETESLAGELAAISRELATSVRGTRLADLAFTNIELIDRNLYERSCDCRWWATDGAVVSVLENPADETVRSSTQERLAVILKAYTVYFDIVVADSSGRILVNGRPDLFQVSGLNCASEPWFQTAKASSSGDDFGFQTVHASALAGGQRVLMYSCKVGRGGKADGECIGVLGVVFRWDALAQTIVKATPLDDQSRASSVVAILDASHVVLSSTDESSIGRSLEVADAKEVFSASKGSILTRVGGRSALVSHAQSPGYETYRTGWYSLVIEFKAA